MWFIGIDKVISSLKLANIYFVILAIGLQVCGYFLYTFRWKYLNHLTNNDFPFKELLPMVLVSLCVNNITPSGRGGGEPVRAYLLSNKEDISFSESFATVIADRTLDTFPFIVLSIITIIGLIFNLTLDPLILTIMIIAVILIIAAVVLLIFVSVNEAFGVKLTNWLSKLIIRIFKKRDPDKIRSTIEKAISGFQSTMKVLTSDKRILYYALPLSFLIWVFEILRVYVVFLAFGSTVSPIVIGEVFIVASLVGMIPLLPGGIGAIDGFMILLYSASGISPSISAAATVVERLISLWMTTILGLIILSFYGADVFDQISASLNGDKSLGKSDEIEKDEETPVKEIESDLEESESKK